MLSLTSLSNSLSSKIDTESTEIQNKINTLQNKIDNLQNNLNTINTNISAINTNIKNLSNGGVDTSTNIGIARNEAYCYRGSRVDNYIKIDGNTYRIIMIDTDNSIIVLDDRNSKYTYIPSTYIKSTSSYDYYILANVNVFDVEGKGSLGNQRYYESWVYGSGVGESLYDSNNDDKYAHRLYSCIQINGGTGTYDNPYTISSNC